MLLAELKTKAERDAFLSLAYTIALADGYMGYAQRILINMYKEEMGMDLNHFLQQDSLTDACHSFIEEHIKKIVFMNLFYLAYVDGYNNNQQKIILDAIRHELNVKSTEVTRYVEEIKIVKAPYFPDYFE